MATKDKKKKKKKKIPKRLVSCGLLIMRGDPIDSFLLMVHRDRLDLPKGHIDKGETNLECAIRELEEETSIRAEDIEIDPDFLYESVYDVRRKRYGNVRIPKTTYIYLARLINEDVKIELTEHEGYLWVQWAPPHKIQKNTIDPLLKSAAKFLAGKSQQVEAVG